MTRSHFAMQDLEPELLELFSPEEESWRNSLAADELARYGGQYIATRRKQIVAAGKSLHQVRRQLKAKGIRHACIEYVEAPDAVVIY